MAQNLLTVARINRYVEKHTGKPIKYRDGSGLFLHVHKQGQASWTYQFRLGGKTLWGTIGPLRLYSLAQARVRHVEFCRIVKEEKRDPRKVVIVTPIISTDATDADAGEATGELLSELLIRYLVEAAPTWKSGKALSDLSEKKIAQLVKDGEAGKEALSYTTTFARLPQFLILPAQSIKPLAFRLAVKAIWPENGATVERMVKRLGTLLDYQRTGKVRGKAPKVKHHDAMPYKDVSAFLRSLATRTTVGARALRWTILTAARTEETLEATWQEITEVDGAPVWSLPGERMKAGLPHVVPLTPEMLEVLGEREEDDQPLFRGGEGGFPNKGVLWQLMKRAHLPYVPHGFRATFRSWAADCTDFPREIAEKALAHTVGGVEGAYNRGDLLAKRRLLMDAWCAFAIAA